MPLRQIPASIADDHGEFCRPRRLQDRGGPVDDPLPVIPARVIRIEHHDGLWQRPGLSQAQDDGRNAPVAERPERLAPGRAARSIRRAVKQTQGDKGGHGEDARVEGFCVDQHTIPIGHHAMNQPAGHGLD